MPFSEDLIAYSIANGKLTAYKTDAFMGRNAVIPSKSENVGPYAVFVDTGGAMSVLSHDEEYPRPSAQVTVMASSGPIAKAKAQELRSLLGNLHNVTLNGTDYMSIRAVQEVMDLSPDAVGRARWGFNLNAEITDLTFELPPLQASVTESLGIHVI